MFFKRGLLSAFDDGTRVIRLPHVSLRVYVYIVYVGCVGFVFIRSEKCFFRNGYRRVCVDLPPLSV